MKQLTIRDIARLAEVSHSTVSRVLNGYPDVNIQTKQKVIDIMKEYDYVPNNSARNLKLNDTRSIGVLTKEINNPFLSKTIQVIQRALDKRGYTVILQQVNSNESEIMRACTVIKEKKLKGVIFLGGLANYEEDELKKLSVPLVFITISPLVNNKKLELYSSVSIDDRKAAFIAVDYLCSLGHKKIALLTSGKGKRTIGDLRYEGYCEALEKNDIPYKQDLVKLTKNSFNIQEAHHLIKELISDKVEFTALFCITDILAMGACRAIKESNLSIPEDVSVMGFDGIDLTQFYIPSICTIRQPLESMAKQGVDILINMIENNSKGQHLLFEVELVQGESCKEYKM